MRLSNLLLCAFVSIVTYSACSDGRDDPIIEDPEYLELSEILI
jgi:hypothetical protein